MIVQITHIIKTHILKIVKEAKLIEDRHISMELGQVILGLQVLTLMNQYITFLWMLVRSEEQEPMKMEGIARTELEKIILQSLSLQIKHEKRQIR